MYQRVVVLLLLIISCWLPAMGQGIREDLGKAIQKLSGDEQFKHAILGMYVVNSKTGEIVFAHNSQAGLAPASCQKIITSVSAYELLGRQFRYKTYIAFDKKISNGVLNGDLFLLGQGDPTTGSNRWKSTTDALFYKRITDILKKNNIQSIAGNLVADDILFTNNPLPNGWVWEDIGNYYGAGAWGINWRENQFDLTFKTSKIAGGVTEIIATKPVGILSAYNFNNFVTTGKRGSGDQAYLFSAPFHPTIIARGTVPVSDNGFTIAGAMPDPPGIFIKGLKAQLEANGFQIRGEAFSSSASQVNNKSIKLPPQIMDSILSPPLDSINYWFLKKSVNLFGEALVKTIAFEQLKPGNTDSGIAIIKKFWNNRGIGNGALKILDGSGLSPANRVTTAALVTVLQFARKRPWFSSFYNALPEMNGIKMKDGYIGGVRSYTGYIKRSNGEEFTFAFIVNNFDGNPATARVKMWKVLDLLK